MSDLFDLPFEEEDSPAATADPVAHGLACRAGPQSCADEDQAWRLTPRR